MLRDFRQQMAALAPLTEISDFGRVLEQSVLQDIGIRRRWGGHFQAAGISTLHYAFKEVDEEQLEELLAE